MPNVTLRELLEAGVHFGHQTGRWNPKMKPFIFAKRNGIYIIDLQKTQSAWNEALQFLEQEAAQGGKVLFVGTKRQAQGIIAEQAQRCGQYYVNYRWLGGLLTNWQTVSKSIDRYREIEAMGEDGRFELLPKKEVLQLEREKFKLERNLIGIKDMGGLPDVLFAVDIRRERIAVAEAVKLGIPVVAIVDTNCDPEGIEFVVPGNDDAIRSIGLFCEAAAEAIRTGQATYEDRVAEAEKAKAEKAAGGKKKAAGGDKKAAPAKEAAAKQAVSTKAEDESGDVEKVEADQADQADEGAAQTEQLEEDPELEAGERGVESTATDDSESDADSEADDASDSEDDAEDDAKDE